MLLTDELHLHFTDTLVGTALAPGAVFIKLS